ncbi:MAG: magnesium transporter [Deltaproteobacteria bacterium]|nr:magnesium transporter [Deltaproteobacteria bacterium]MBW2445138.1 magnesium transporter [Deltaproteobacteria bacterium]
MADPQLTTRVLRRLLANGLVTRAERLLARSHPADLAPMLGDLHADEVRTVVDILFRQHRAAATLRELPPEIFPQIFDALGDQRLADILTRLEIDDMLEMVEWLPEERRQPVTSRLPEEKAAELRKAERYPADSAGRAMTTRFVGLGLQMTAQQAIDRIRAVGDDTEAILYLYVVDEKGRLAGVVPIRRLVSAPPERALSELMIHDPVRCRADDDQEQAAQAVARYNLLAIPVVDEEDRLLGVITVDDVIEVITEEATEDIYNLAGLHEADRVFTTPLQSFRRRLPWMLLNLGALFVAAWVIGLFEHTLEQLVALAFFMPVVAGMGGNSGIQSLTVITRGIALGEIEFSSGLRLVAKELAVALAIGAVAGAVAAAMATLWQGSALLGGVLFVSMVVTIGVAGMLGAAVPLLLKALHQDPALGSGVIVTTVTDVVGFITFLGMGTLLIERLS